MPEDAEIRPWSYDDDELFDEDEAICRLCDGPFRVGQRVQERPALSLRFFHVDQSDCDD